MTKKFLALFTIFISNILLFGNVYWANAPSVNCVWLPGCPDSDIANPSSADVSQMNTLVWISNIVWELIKYVAVVAVISLMIAWVMYMVSGGEEEKTKKAKNWIIWSLVWVLLSISAWWIIKMLNAINIWNTSL